MKIQNNKENTVGIVNDSGYNPQKLTNIGLIHSFDELMDDMFDSFWREPAFLQHRNWRPSEVNEDKENIYLEIELPRFKKEEVKVEVKHKSVLITAKNNRSSFSRAFSLNGVDLEKVECKLENGLLTVILPKSIEAKAKEIIIK